MSIRILAKHALQFDHPEEEGVSERIAYQEIKTLPDWVVESATYKMAIAGEAINIIDVGASVNAEDVEAKVKRAPVKAEV